MTNITPIVNMIIAFIGLVLTVLFVPWIKKKISKEDMNKMLELIRIAVSAAQQLYWDKDGDFRNAYVLDFLAKQGYDICDEAVLNAIEAEVLKLHQALIADDGDDTDE